MNAIVWLSIGVKLALNWPDCLGGQISATLQHPLSICQKAHRTVGQPGKRRLEGVRIAVLMEYCGWGRIIANRIGKESLLPAFLFGHDGVELLLGNEPILVEVGLVDHFLKFSFVDILAELPHHLLQTLDGNIPRFLLVEVGEYLVHVPPGVLGGDPLRHHVQKFVEVDLRVVVVEFVLDHHVERLVPGFGAEGVERGQQF